MVNSRLTTAEIEQAAREMLGRQLSHARYTTKRWTLLAREIELEPRRDQHGFTVAQITWCTHVFFGSECIGYATHPMKRHSAHAALNMARRVMMWPKRNWVQL